MVTVVIPARLASTRLPNKVLLDLGGKPVLQHAWERACEMQAADRIYIATDSTEVADAATAWGASVKMTSPDCPSGTYRLASLLDEMEGDFFLNVQGDEPFVDATLLDRLVQIWKDKGCDLVTAVCPIDSLEDLINPNLVKAVLTHERRVLYFSRSPIPYIRGLPQREWLAQHRFWGHLGVYGYTRKTLSEYPQLKASVLEEVEKLEQLRFLDHGYTFFASETEFRPIGIDTPEDLEAARERLKAK